MTRDAGSDGELSSLDFALDQFETSLDHLVKLVEDGAGAACDDSEFVAFMQRVERVRNRIPLLDHQIVNDARARGLPEALCQATPIRMLMAVLRLSPGEAARRVRAADAVAVRTSMTGEPLPPTRAVLAAAQRAGDVSPEQVAVIERALARVDHRGFDPGDLDAGEAVLTEFARSFGPKELRGLAERVVDRIDPDGTVPDEELNRDRRHFHLRQTRDGAWCGEFRLTGEAGARLHALLVPLARPRLDSASTPGVNTLDAPDGGAAALGDGVPLVARAPRPAHTVDPRSHGQRMHDALEELCAQQLRRGGESGRGGVPATVVVHIDAEKLRTNTGHGVTSDGTWLSTAQVRRLANEAEVYFACRDRRGVVLDLYRSRRLASRGQTIALYARDAGCSFPGCDRAPEHCERHHIVGWANGGQTNLDNLTLLCSYHHHNFASRGWTCTINAERLPEWRPPRWIDPRQRPLLNARIRATPGLASPPRE